MRECCRCSPRCYGREMRLASWRAVGRTLIVGARKLPGESAPVFQLTATAGAWRALRAGAASCGRARATPPQADGAELRP